MCVWTANLLGMLKQFSKRNSSDEKGELVISSCCEDSSAVLKCLVSGFFAHAAKLDNSGFYRYTSFHYFQLIKLSKFKNYFYYRILNSLLFTSLYAFSCFN